MGRQVATPIARWVRFANQILVATSAGFRGADSVGKPMPLTGRGAAPACTRHRRRHRLRSVIRSFIRPPDRTSCVQLKTASGGWAPTAMAEASRCFCCLAVLWVAGRVGPSSRRLSVAWRRGLAGRLTCSSSTAFSRSAICCATDATSSVRSPRGALDEARSERVEARRPRYRADGRRRLPPRRCRKPEREPRQTALRAACSGT